jgi:hypothetical protein
VMGRTGVGGWLHDDRTSPQLGCPRACVIAAARVIPGV